MAMDTGWRRIAGLAVLGILLGGAAPAPASFDLSYAVGEFGIGRESFNRPVDVVEDREENIYVVDQGNNRIQVLDRRGRFVREWGSRGFAPGSFDTPVAIALDPAGNLFVVDSLNHRVQKFDPNGKLLMTLGRLGSGDGDFNKPTDVAIDKKGSIFVVDAGNNRLQKFDSSGKFLAEWGRFARRRGVQLTNPVSVAYSEEGLGYIFVVSSPECVVQKFDSDGNLAGSWPMHKKGEGAQCGTVRIRIEPRRYTVYIADTENNRVLVFDRNGEPLDEIKEGKVAFRKPRGLFVTNIFAEDVIVADTGNNLIQKFRRAR